MSEFLLYQCRVLNRCTFCSGGVSVFVVTCLCLLGVVSVGSAGIAISTASIIPQRLYFILSNYQRMTNNINAMERVQEYLNAPREKDAPSSSTRATLIDWPKDGHVCVSNAVAKYAPELPHVLRGVSFEVKPGDKVSRCARSLCVR